MDRRNLYFAVLNQPRGTTMDPISLEDLALLDILQQINQSNEAAIVEAEMKKRLTESALVEEGEHGLALTPAGIALCKSLQHRVAADKIAEKLLEQREGSAAV
ncbi:hypothetical protein [Luteimonas sp. RIT-PG2_3]